MRINLLFLKIALIFFVAFSGNLIASSISGIVTSDTTWSGNIDVVADVRITGNHTLTISSGTILKIKKGANIIAESNSHILISGTSSNKVYISNTEGNYYFGGITASGNGASVEIHYADIQGGPVKAYSGATLLVTDSYLHDFTDPAGSSIYTKDCNDATVQRCHVSNYRQLNFVNTFTLVEDCLLEYITEDGIDFDNSPAGTILRRCTIRHGVGIDIDAIDFGKLDFKGYGSQGSVDNCKVYDFSDKGISIGEGCMGVTANSNLIYNTGVGVAIKDSSLATLINNTVYGCDVGMEGVEKNPGLGGGHGTGYNNIIWACHENTFTNSDATLTLEYSIIQGTTVYPGNGNLNSDPLFVNPATYDFNLQSNSPANGSGQGGTSMGAIFPLGGFEVDVNYLALGFPRPNTNFYGDSLQSIRWTAGASISIVKLEYSTDGGTNWNVISASQSAGAGVYDWQVPNTYKTKCKIRITDVNNTINQTTNYGFFNILPTGNDTAIKPVFSHPAGFYNSSIQLAIGAQAGATIYYTLDGSDPSEQSFTYTAPLNVESDTILPGFPEVNITSTTEPSYPISYIRSSPVSQVGPNPCFFQLPTGNIFKATIVKAMAYVPGKGLSKVVTHSYFVDPTMLNGRYQFPVVSLVTDIHNLYDYYKGVYIPGAAFNGNSFTGNYEQRGRESERPVHIEMFEPNGTKAFSQDIGIRVKGEWIRNLSQKSLGLFARSEYDSENYFRYEVFPGFKRHESVLPMNKFKHLVLRNGGNDFPWPIINTIFKDGFAQSLIQNMHIKVQNFRPSILFINGEYWGIYSLMEERDARSLENHYGLNSDSITIVEHNLTGHNQLAEGNKVGLQEYIDLVNYVSNNNISQANAFNYVKSKIDIESFADSWIATIFLGKFNYDHNTSFWKYMGNDGNNSKYGSDGRWRWLGNDFDAALNHAYVGYDHLQWCLGGGPDYLIANLLQNSEFKTYFLNRFADEMNTIFKSSYSVSKINDTKQLYSSSVSEHINRWGSPAYYSEWSNAVDSMKYYLIERPVYQKEHLMNYFNCDTNLVSINVSDANKGKVQISTLVIDENTIGLENPTLPYPWKGTYFTNYSIPLKAIPNPGYKFVKWLETNNTNPELSITLTSDTLFTAVFEEDSTYIFPGKLYINEVLASNLNSVTDEYGEHEDWIEIYNSGSDTIDIGGYYFTDGFNTTYIPEGNDSTKIAPDGFKLIWADDDKSQGVLHLNFKLNAIKDFIAFYHKDRCTLIDSVSLYDQVQDISYGREEDGSSAWIYFNDPTPRVSNGTTSLKEAAISEGSKLFPNPSTGLFYLKYKTKSETTVSLQLTDILGKEMYYNTISVTPDGLNQIDLSSMSKGVYLLRLTEKNHSCIKKIIIQ